MSVYHFNPNQEQWKDIPDFPGYQVSDRGKVRSFWQQKGNGCGKGGRYELSEIPQKMISLFTTRRGYLMVRLPRNKIYRGMLVHRLVLIAFIGPCPSGMYACHNDGNQINNILPNLRWDTPQSNQADRHKHGTAYYPGRKPKRG